MQEKIKILPTYFKLEDLKRVLAMSYLDLALVFISHEEVKHSDEKFLHNLQQAIKLDFESASRCSWVNVTPRSLPSTTPSTV